MPLAVHIRLYNPNMQHLAVQVAQLVTSFGYEVGPIEHAREPRDFKTVELEPGAGAPAADEAPRIVEQLIKAGLAPVKLLPPSPELSAETIHIKLSGL